MAHIFAGDDEVASILVPATQDDVRMRVVGVPMIDRDPSQPRAEGEFRPPHHLAGVAFQISEPAAVFRGKDDPEVTPVLPSPGRRTRVAIDAVVQRVVKDRSFGAALQITRMRLGRGFDIPLAGDCRILARQGRGRRFRGRIARHIARVRAERRAAASAVSEIMDLHDRALTRVELELAGVA